MSEKTKLAKFEVILGDILTWLREAQYCSDGTEFRFWFPRGIYHPTIFDGYTSNPYVDTVTKFITYADEKGYANEDICEMVLAYESNPSTDFQHQRNCMIFWMLFLAAIDDEIYNNELDSIIDIAYCMDFNEAMIRDWCRAVEYVIQGNRFSDNCNLECETEEGKKFFLHQS